MTRINCIPVSELHDKHLLAEYRELPRVFKLARPLLSKEIVPEYTMGTGHVKFFYDKLKYCHNRQTQIYEELLKRGFRPKHLPNSLYKEWYMQKRDLWKNWKPSNRDRLINRERINERLKTMKGASK